MRLSSRVDSQITQYRLVSRVKKRSIVRYVCSCAEGLTNLSETSNKRPAGRNTISQLFHLVYLPRYVAKLHASKIKATMLDDQRGLNRFTKRKCTKYKLKKPKIKPLTTKLSSITMSNNRLTSYVSRKCIKSVIK